MTKTCTFNRNKDLYYCYETGLEEEFCKIIVLWTAPKPYSMKLLTL